MKSLQQTSHRFSHCKYRHTLKFSITFPVSSLYVTLSLRGQLSIFLSPSATLCLSFAQLLWGWTICEAHKPTRFQSFFPLFFFAWNALWVFLCHSSKKSKKNNNNPQVNYCINLLTRLKHCQISVLESGAHDLFRCSWTIWTVALGRLLCLRPDCMREKWTQTVTGSLGFLYTCRRLLQPYNCENQVARQTCERSLQAYVGVGPICPPGIDGVSKSPLSTTNVSLMLLIAIYRQCLGGFWD